MYVECTETEQTRRFCKRQETVSCSDNHVYRAAHHQCMLPVQHVKSECAVIENRPAVGCMFADVSAVELAQQAQ